MKSVACGTRQLATESLRQMVSKLVTKAKLELGLGGGSRMRGCSGVSPEHPLGVLLALSWEQREGPASAGASEAGVGTEACSRGTSQAP